MKDRRHRDPAGEDARAPVWVRGRSAAWSPARPPGRDQRGAAALEFVVVAPVLLLVIGLVIAGGRLALARVAVQQWADSAARTASLARDAGTARSQARAVVASDAAGSDAACGDAWSLELDTAAFGRPPGQPGSVTATVVCPVPLANLVPGLPGTLRVEATASSTLDRYRGRR